MSVRPSGLRRRILALVCVLAVSATALPPSARADNVEDARKNADKAQEYIEYLQERVSILEEDMREAEEQLGEAQAAVAESQLRIGELETKLGEIQGDLGELALQTFISGDQASASGSLLTGTSSVTEIVEREEYARLAMSEGQTTTDELDAVISDLEAERDLLEDRQSQAEHLVAAIADKQEARDAAETEAQQYAERAQDELGQALVDAEKRRQEALLAEQAAAQAAAAARVAAQSASNNGGGGTREGGSSSSGTSSGSTSSGSPSSGSSSSSSSGGAGKFVPDPSPGASGAVNAAISQIGVSYRYAASSPGEAFDCSGLTAWAWEQAGVSLPHQSRSQYASTTRVSPADAQPGDLIFFYNPISHVGIYIGNGMMVDAANHATGVRQTAINWGKVVGVGRPG